MDVLERKLIFLDSFKRAMEDLHLTPPPIAGELWGHYSPRTEQSTSIFRLRCSRLSQRILLPVEIVEQNAQGQITGRIALIDFMTIYGLKAVYSIMFSGLSSSPP